MKRLLAFAPVALFMVVLVGFGIGLRHDPSKLPSQLIGKPLPAFSLPALRSEETTLNSADLKGQPALLNVFASWCGPCLVENPMLMRLKDQGVPIYGVDWKEDAGDGARWLAQNGDPFLRVGNDRTGRTGIDLGVSGVPETFVVDKRGVVRYRHVGAISSEDWAKTLEPLMAKLRAES